MSRRPAQPGTAKFVALAVVLMIFADQFIFGGTRSYIEDARQTVREEQAQEPPPQEVEVYEVEETVPEESDPLPEQDSGEVVEEYPAEEVMTDVEAPPEEAVSLPEVIPPSRKGMKIAIVIDDLGMNVKNSKAIIDLPAPITLAFLPYAAKTRELAVIGKAKGHELIIHAPMEAMDGSKNIGPGGLKVAMDAPAFDAAFDVMLASFDGYVGINNHMGSRLTQDRAKMARLMEHLRGRNLFFLDSKTIEASVGAKEAVKAGVAYAERDVFLDHVDDRAFVDKALRQTEAAARRKGYAIAIGHPKDATIAGLRAWIPTLAAKGIELVPVSALLTRPKVIQIQEEIVPTVDLFVEQPAISTSSPDVIGGAMDPPVKPGDDRDVGALDDKGGEQVFREDDAGSTAPSDPVSVVPEGLNLRLQTLSPAP